MFKYGDPWLQSYGICTTHKSSEEDGGHLKTYDLVWKLLHMAFPAICCASIIQAKWNLEILDWPATSNDALSRKQWTNCASI